jgi:ActR/RegA family two-component response regulator
MEASMGEEADVHAAHHHPRGGESDHPGKPHPGDGRSRRRAGVAVAETAADAIAAIEKRTDSWQLAVEDIFLREGSGLSVLRACSTRRAGQRVIVLTNYPTAEMRRRCLELGADAVFDKSNELDAFFARCMSYQLPYISADSSSVDA